MNKLVTSVGNYVLPFLKENLSAELSFHNLTRTLEVVLAANEIGQRSGLTPYEQEVLITTAWFHDCGYANVYTGHEEESKKIARRYLESINAATGFVSLVVEGIEATKFPQQPKTLIEMVLCDADLHYFTKTSYPDYTKAIRTELHVFLQKTYSDEEWHQMNYAMLSEHRYWTVYGKTILNKFKQVNKEVMKCR